MHHGDEAAALRPCAVSMWWQHRDHTPGVGQNGATRHGDMSAASEGSTRPLVKPDIILMGWLHWGCALRGAGATLGWCAWQRVHAMGHIGKCQ